MQPLGEAMTSGAGIDIHLAYAAVLDFQAETGAWPRTQNAEDAAAVVALAEKISDSRKETEGACWAQKFMWGFPASAMGETDVDRPVDAVRIGRFAKLFGTELTGFCAFLGGAVAQEVIKKTGQYLPIDGWVHHEDQGLVTDESPANVSPLGTRYDNQVMILGKDFQARCADQKVFLVGCGALGCEYLKAIALMGVGCGKRGKVVVTDNDEIDISNLSRQFLFRQQHVGAAKSAVGVEIVKAWNPSVSSVTCHSTAQRSKLIANGHHIRAHVAAFCKTTRVVTLCDMWALGQRLTECIALQLNVEGIQHFVGPNTSSAGKEEQFFTDEFWDGLDVCWNALDNVKARKYTGESHRR